MISLLERKLHSGKYNRSRCGTQSGATLISLSRPLQTNVLWASMLLPTTWGVRITCLTPQWRTNSSYYLLVNREHIGRLARLDLQDFNGVSTASRFPQPVPREALMKMNLFIFENTSFAADHHLVNGFGHLTDDWISLCRTTILFRLFDLARLPQKAILVTMS